MKPKFDKHVCSIFHFGKYKSESWNLWNFCFSKKVSAECLRWCGTTGLHEQYVGCSGAKDTRCWEKMGYLQLEGKKIKQEPPKWSQGKNRVKQEPPNKNLPNTKLNLPMCILCSFFWRNAFWVCIAVVSSAKLQEGPTVLLEGFFVNQPWRWWHKAMIPISESKHILKRRHTAQGRKLHEQKTTTWNCKAYIVGYALILCGKIASKAFKIAMFESIPKPRKHFSDPISAHIKCMIKAISNSQS